jgi:hypothetical protein
MPFDKHRVNERDVMTPVRIVIFAKVPVPGRVKTRLIPALGEAGAARLAARMLDLEQQGTDHGFKPTASTRNVSPQDSQRHQHTASSCVMLIEPIREMHQPWRSSRLCQTRVISTSPLARM